MYPVTTRSGWKEMMDGAVSDLAEQEPRDIGRVWMI
jgi:hypothetical protein